MTELIGAELGRHNRMRVLEWLSAHPGARQGECAKALGLSSMAVNRAVRKIRQDWSRSEIPPAIEGHRATRRHWVIVKEPGRISEKKGPFRHDQVLGFVRELIDCRSSDTAITVASLTWDYDIWLEEGRQMVAEDKLFSSLTAEEWDEIFGESE